MLPLLLFCAGLVVCLLGGHNVIWALLFGYAVFASYGLYKRLTIADLIRASFSGVKKVYPIALVMLLIGALTASWRASGTIPTLVVWASGVIQPEFGLLGAFLMNGVVSVLTGTSFGTTATMGVITMAMLSTMGFDPAMSAGAVLAGVYVGDRCSPVSTSAQLVCAVTDTEIYKNVRLMVQTGMVPMVLACAAYLFLGLLADTRQSETNLEAFFGNAFNLSAWTLLPAAVILVCIAVRLGVKLALSASLVSAAPICLLLQKMDAWGFLKALLTGFDCADASVGTLVNGGGVTSMLPVCAVILTCSTYAGLFEKTGLLNTVKKMIGNLARRLSVFGTIVVTSLVTIGIACNQALPIMLTREICREIEPDNQKMAIDLENSVVVLAPLVPWCIAGAIPLTILNAAPDAIPWACYLWLLPLWQLAVQNFKLKKFRSRLTA